MAEKRKSIDELLEESRKKNTSNANNSATGNTARKSIDELLLESRAPSAIENLNARLKKYAEDSYSFSQTYQNRYFDKEGNYKNQYRADTSDWLSIVTKAKDQSDAEAREIKRYLEAYKSYIPEESYKEIYDMLNQGADSFSGIYNSSAADNRYWSQWESEDKYKQALAEAERQEELRNYNLKTGMDEIEALKAELAKTRAEAKSYVPSTPSEEYLKQETTPEARERAIREHQRRQRQNLDYAVEDLENQIREKEAYYNQAERVQDAYKLGSVSNPESEFYDPNFEHYAAAGEALSVPSMFDASAYNGEIQNPAKYARENWEANGKSEKWLDNDYKAYEDFNIDTRYLLMSDDEYKTYNYYLAKDSENARRGQKTSLADEYFASIEESLNVRRGSEMGDAANDKGAVYQTLFGLAMGAKTNLESLGNIFSKEDYIPTSTYQAANQVVAQNMADKGWWADKAYQTSNVIGNMLPSIAIGAATGGIGGMVGGTAGAAITIGGQILGNAEMGLSAAGNAYQGMLNEGYNQDQARLYGSLVGASEAVLQYALGGISSLGGKMSGGVVSKILSKVDNALGRFAIKYAGNIASEITEEELQLFIEPFLKSAIFDMDYDAPNFDEMLDTAIVTFFSTGILEGPSTVSGEVGIRNTGKAVMEDGNVDRLVDLGKTFSADTVAHELANKVDKNTGAYTIGRLLNEVNASLSEQNRTDIKNALVEKGVTEAQAETLAKWMNHVVEGGNLTKKQQVALENNSVLGEVLYGTIIQPNSTVMQRKQTVNQLYGIANSMMADRKTLEETQTPESISQRINYRNAVASEMRSGADSRRGLSEADLSQIADFSSKARTTIPETNYQDVGQSASKVSSFARIADTTDKMSDTGKPIVKSTGEEVSINKIASIDAKNKTIKLELSNGTVVDSKDISYGDKNQAALYESVLLMGYDPHTANAIVHGYTPSDTMSVEDYLIGTNEAFNYGWGHIPEKARTGVGYKALTQSQKEYAVKLGEDARAADDNARGVKASQNQTQATKKKAKGGYGARLSVDKNAVTDRVDKSVKALDAVAKALKLNMTIADLGGNAYGFYKSSTNELIIDVKAGGNGKNTLLFTASHELVHYIRNWSPEKFTVLADFLMEQYAAKGENIDVLIQAEIDKAYKATRGKHKMTYDEAYEEVVAQAMQRFMTDSNFIEHLSSLQKKDANLAKRLIAKLKEILDNIRAAYQGMDTNDRASQAVKEMGEAIDELYAKMEEALIAASEASHSIGSRNLEDFAEAKNTDGETLFQYKAMEADEETYRQMLKKHSIMSEAEINNLFSTIDKALVIIKNNLEILDYAWEADIDDRSFSPVKPNSDNLYKVSLDFSTLCRKRILQQVIQTQLQDALNKPLSREESIAIRDELMKIQEEGRQIEIACALCYVESARMKSPAQIKKFLKDRERVINEFLASKSGGDIKQKIKQAEADARERLGVGNAPLKSMPDKIADQIRAAKRQARQSYVPTAEEQKLIDAAKKMSVTDFTSPEGLSNLAKNYPVLFDAYTSFVRNATKSKGIEKDTWWRAGDSKSIGDTLIANMNRENGLRSQSWSDFQVIHLLDYIAATIELSTRNAKEQAYSKVPDYIELMGNTGVMLNMSLIPMAKFNGKLEYDGVEGMAYKKALELREKYHATAGTICIGISDEQIKMLLDDSSIDYVIPYHKSGMAAHIRKLMHIPTWSEYEKYQNETNLSRAEAIKQAKKYGVKLLNENDENYQKHTAFSEWFDIEEARQIAKQENAFPTEAKLQKKYGVMYGGYMAMQNAADNYLKLCAERGIAPKFSHENANFTEEANYWKLIIDRKMVDNVTGEIIEQQAIKPIFDEGEILRILNDELERYPSVKADQDYATRTVVEKFLSGKMNDRLDPDTVAAIMQKPVDNIAVTNIVASEEGVKAQYAEEDSSRELPITGKTGTDIIVKMNALVATNHNTPLTDGDLDAYLKVGVKKKTRDKKERLLEEGKKPILTTSDEVADFMDKVVKNEARNEVRAFAIVGKRLANEVKGIKRDVDVLGRYIELNANFLKESYDKHLMPKEPGDIELSEDDFKNIPQLLDEFDAVMSVNSYNEKVEIHLAKKSPNGYIMILTLLSNERGSLQVIKLVGNSNKKFEKKYPIKKGKITGSHVSQTEISEGENPDTPDMHTAGDSSDIIIQDEKQNVKTNMKLLTSTLNMQDEMGEVDETTATAEYANIASSEDLKAQYIDTDDTYNYIGKEVLGYNEGNKKPDLTLVEIVNERTGLTETTIKFYGEKPKDYVPKKIAYCYKLFEQHPDGTLHALFAGASNATPIGEWVYSQGFPYTDSGVKGMNLRERYGWHLSAGLPSAPHLMSSKEFERGYPSKNSYGHPKGSKRVWVRMAYDATTDFNSIADSTRKGDIFGLIPFGGYYAFKENNQSEWVISSAVKIDKILTEDERQQILSEAGYDEYEAWRKKHRATEAEKAEAKRKSAENKKAKDMAAKAGLNYLSESSKAMREAIKSRIIDNPELEDVKHQYADTDSNGNKLSEGQQEFFKDSKVRDKDGKLMVVYHGSPNKFFTFRQGVAEGWGEGIYFTDNPAEAAEYGETLVKAYLNIKNPYNADTMNYYDIGAENTKAYQDFDRKYWERWYDEYDTYEEYRDDGMGVDIDMIYTEYVEVFNKILRELGYDGIIAYKSNNIDGFEIVAFDESQPKLTTNKTPTSDPDIRFQYKDTDPIDNRSLLAKALEGAAKTDLEKQKLKEYQSKINLINAEEKKLRELRAEIKEISFTKGPRDTEKLKKLQFEAKQAANRINVYDKQLLRLEATKPLAEVVQREKDLVRKRMDQQRKKDIAAVKERDMATIREIMDKHTESRKKTIEGRNKTQMRHKIKDVVGELNQLLLKGTKDKHVMIGLQKAVASALDAVNMDTVGADERVAKYDTLIAKAKDPDVIASLKETRDRIAEQGDKMNERLTALKNSYKEIKNSKDPLIANSHDEVIESKIESVVNSIGDTPLRDMTLEQLEDVYDMYKMVLTTIRNSNKAFKMDKAESIASLGNNIMGEIESIAGSKEYTVKALEGIKKFGWNSLKPTQAFELIGSGTFKKVFVNVRAGEDAWAVDINEAREYYREKSKKYKYDSWDLEKKYDFLSKTGKPFRLSLEQIMSLYAYSKRKQADLHLDQGGFVFDDSIEVVENKKGIPVKYKVNTARAYSISKDALTVIIDKLTGEQKAFVDEMQTYLSEVMGEKGNEVSLEMYGVKLFKEKHYFPLKSAKQFMFEQNEVAGEVRIKNSGFSKETVANANNPIILSNFMDVWAKHVNDMSMYHAFVLPLEDFNRVFNYKTPTGDKLDTESVKMCLQNAYGTQPVQYIKQLLTDLNGGARVDPNADIVNKGIALFKKGAVFASASVVIQQPSAIARAFAYIDPKYFATAKVDLRKHSTDWEECKKYAPVARIKEMGYFDTNVGMQTTEWITAKEYNGFKEKLKGLKDSNYRDEVLSKAPALADELSWTYIWNAVKKEVASTTNLAVGSEEFLKRAGERFTEVVVNTQVYDSVLTRSGLMRSKDTGMKMATAFMAEPTTSLNMIVNSFVQAKRGNKRFARKIGGAVAASIILNSILVSLVYAARDDDDDETYAEKYLGSLLSELLDGFNPITYIPFVKDIWSIAQGYDVERSDMSAYSKLWESFEELFDEKKSVANKVLDFSGSVATMFGIPLKNITRDVTALIRSFANELGIEDTTTAGIGYSLSDSLRNSIPLLGRFYEEDTKAEKLYDAILSGDTKQISRMKAQFKDDKAIATALRKALRENDPRINEAAQARLNGDATEYKRIAREIVSEGHFTQDDVVAAINAAMNKLGEDKEEDTPETEEEDKATSYFSSSDINNALESGDTAEAREVINDIMQVKTENYISEGYKKSEAEKKAKSSIRSSLTSYWKPLYLAAYKAKNNAEMKRIRNLLHSTKIYDDVITTCQDWVKQSK